MRWLFWCGVAFAAYAYFGYVGWLWLRARLRPWPVLRGPQEPSISVVMVVHNEEACIDGKLGNLLELDYPQDRLQIVVVSDGSTDRTESILRRHASDPRVQVVMNQLSRGKSSGLNDGVALASGEVVVFTDVRQRIEPGAIRRLMENFADPEIGCVSGALMLGDSRAGEAAKGMSVYWRMEKKIRELESASGSVVGATGALYAVRHELLTAVPEGTILDDVYIPMQVVRQGRRVIFEARARAWDHADLGAEREFSRKVRTLTGNYQLLRLSPWLLRAENPLRFEFVSHKLARLAVPFALLATLGAAGFLRGPFYGPAFGVQLGFYGLACLGWTGWKLGPLSRLSDAAYTFAALNVAALFAFANFVTGYKPSWAQPATRGEINA
jgi:poly-beta-1,6-N-acetyl-D-glucosamine synthase